MSVRVMLDALRLWVAGSRARLGCGEKLEMQTAYLCNQQRQLWYTLSRRIMAFGVQLLPKFRQLGHARDQD